MNNNNIIIKVLIRSNYKRWKQDIEFALEIADIDLVLCVNKSDDLNDQSPLEQNDHFAK